MKIAENSTDYSVHNTAKQIVWLPVTREMKYRAKPAIDTLFVRLGDGLAAVTAFVGTNVFDVSVGLLFGLNALVAVFWLGTGIVVIREYRGWTRRSPRRPKGRLR